MKKSYKNDAMNSKKLYNVLLVGFAILMVGWLIEHGPPSLANPQHGTTPLEQACSPLGVSPTQIRRYEMWDGETRLSVERIEDSGEWQFQNESDEFINQEIAEIGAHIIAAFQLCTLVPFEEDDDLSQYGLTLSPRYVISFGVEDMNNDSGAEQGFTLYIGDLNPSQQDYYAVFPDASERQQLQPVDDWVYLMSHFYVDDLADAMFNWLRAEDLPSSIETGTPEPSP